MIDEVTLNANKPKETETGYKMLDRMNLHHKDLHAWALEHISNLKDKKFILDVGFGGGQNIKNLLELAPASIINGIDYSTASCKKCSEFNKEGIKANRVFIKEATAENMDFKESSFDLVTAFETIYYWNNIETCFKNIFFATKAGGEFLICNEDSDIKGNEEIQKALNMKFYKADELSALLLKAGFKSAEGFTHKNGKWVCAIGIK